MYGRIDLQKKYNSALKTLFNYLPRPQGGVVSRPGTKYLSHDTADGSFPLFIEFLPNSQVSFVIEVREGKILVYPSDDVLDGTYTAPSEVVSFHPYLWDELSEIQWDYTHDSILLSHPNHPLKELRYNGRSASPMFTLSDFEFKAPPFKREEDELSFKFTEETNYIKLTSSEPTEFDSVGAAKYLEFRFDGQWQLGRLAGISYGDTFADGTNVPDPSGDTCYIVPINRMVTNFSRSTKSVVVDKDYLYTTTPDPEGSLDADTVTQKEYPELSPGTDYWFLRADTQIFTDDMVGAWVRFRSDFSSVLDADKYSDNKVRWGRIYKRIGQEPHPTRFVYGPKRSDFEEGEIYKVIRKGTETAPDPEDPRVGFSLHTHGPVEASDGNRENYIRWDFAFQYQEEGDTFQVGANFWRPKGGDFSYEAVPGQTNPFGPKHLRSSGGWDMSGDGVLRSPEDFFSSDSLLASLDSRISFDVAVLDKLVGEPVGDGTQDNELMTLSGNTTMFSKADNLGRIGKIRCSDLFFYESGVNDEGVRPGQFIMGFHKDSWVTYRILSVSDAYEADARMVDGTPEVDLDTGEIYDEGRFSRYRVSVFKDGNHPYSVAFHEGRLVLGGCPEFPEDFWISKLEYDNDFRTVENNGQVLETSGIHYPLPGKAFDRITWMESGATLSIGTITGEWQVRPQQFGQGISQTNLRVSQQTNHGSFLRPVRAGSVLLFVDASGKKLREYFFDYQQDQHDTRDATVYTDHLFSSDPVVGFTYQRNPFGILWFYTESGKLLSMTYDRQQGVYSWARHATSGKVVGAATLKANESTDGEDRVLLWVEREVSGGTNLATELMEPVRVEYDDLVLKEGLTTLDSAIRTNTYNGGYIEGLDHLEGVEVVVMVNGASFGTATVSSGKVPAPDTAIETEAYVGVPFIPELETLPLALFSPDMGPIYGLKKRVVEVGLHFYQSLGVEIHASGKPNNPVFRRSGDSVEYSAPLTTGFYQWNISDTYRRETTVKIRQTLPFPSSVNLIQVSLDIANS